MNYKGLQDTGYGTHP